MRNTRSSSTENSELQAELLKERIYATLALLAVLVSLDPGHTTPFNAFLIITGTIVSLWLASLVATLLARRVVYQNQPDIDEDRQYQLKKHAPMLAVLLFPTIVLILSEASILPLPVAINMCMAISLLALAVWAILSVKSIKATKYIVLLFVSFELIIILGVVALKASVGH